MGILIHLSDAKSKIMRERQISKHLKYQAGSRGDDSYHIPLFEHF